VVPPALLPWYRSDEAQWYKRALAQGAPDAAMRDRELFQRLAEAVPWQEHYRWLFRQRFLEPRLTAEYRRLTDAPHPALVAAGDALSRHYGVRYDNLWLNLYRGGEDSTGPPP